MTPCLALTTGTRRRPTCPQRRRRRPSTRASRASASQGSVAIWRAPPRRSALSAVDTVARALNADGVVEPPGADVARSSAYLITMVEGAALHLERLRTRAGDFDPDVRDRLIAGAMLPGGLGHAGAKISAPVSCPRRSPFFATSISCSRRRLPAVLQDRSEDSSCSTAGRCWCGQTSGFFTQPLSS